VVRECDKDASNEGSSVRARGRPASLHDQLQPEDIERDGSGGPYGDNVIDRNDEMAERLGVSFHAQQVTLRRCSAAAAPAPAASRRQRANRRSPAACELELAPQDE
jgi:hypothetical protein